MKALFDALRALRTTMKNAFRRPTTVEFPAVVRPRAERYRASFALPDDEHGELACIGCLACERICPSQVIRMKATGKKESPVTGKKRQYVDAFVLDLTACIQCELCVQVCNSDAIYMVREPEVPAFSREDLVLDLDKLRANAREKTAAWGRGTVLQEMQESKPKAEKAEKKPAAAKAAPADAPPAVTAGPVVLASAPAVAAPVAAAPVVAAPVVAEPLVPPPPRPLSERAPKMPEEA